MKKITVVMALFGYMAAASAQEKINMADKKHEKIETMKIAMINNSLDLSQEQATNFWPVYNEYQNKKREIKNGLREHFSASKSLANTDDKIMTELKEIHTLRQKDVDLDKEYMSKLLKVINARQLVELYKTEHTFKQILLRRLEPGHNMVEHQRKPQLRNK
jgi:Spy/CpxP family protein refolding chaperone